MRNLVLFIAVLIGAWLSFDGVRALATGDYVTHRGELGPWSRVVSSIGLAPRGTVMKVVHVALGVAWLVAAALFVARVPIARSALLGCSVVSLWYVPFGTLLSLIEIVLLFLPALRK